MQNRAIKRGIVSAGHEKTAEAAIAMLRDGGNAFDAAAAALLASIVAEPLMSSAGGGGFMCAIQGNQHSFVTDFFCQTPAAKPNSIEIDFQPVTICFGTATEVFHVGMASMATPGNIAGVFHLINHYCNLPASRLFEPVIDYAKNGLEINSFQHQDFCLLKPIIDLSDKGREIFFDKEEPKQVGEVVKMPELADLLECLAIEGSELFYKGEIASKIDDASKNKGGFLRKQDFEQYSVIERKPLEIQFCGRQIHTNPPPSFGGLKLAEMLRYFEDYGESLKRFNVDRLKVIDRAFQDAEGVNLGAHVQSRKKLGSTTHLSICDNQGNALAMTLSNGEGCGYFPDGTGFMMNNMLGEEALMPNGFHSWRPNSRVNSLMSPTLITEPISATTLALGTGGAGRIPGTLAQTLSNLYQLKMPLEEAIEASRAYCKADEISFENDFEEMSNEAFSGRNLRRWVEPDMFFGGVNATLNQNDRLSGYSDRRRKGITMSC